MVSQLSPDGYQLRALQSATSLKLFPPPLNLSFLPGYVKNIHDMAWHGFETHMDALMSFPPPVKKSRPHEVSISRLTRQSEVVEPAPRRLVHSKFPPTLPLCPLSPRISKLDIFEIILNPVH